MNELTERLTAEQPIVMGGANPAVAELRERTGEMGYVLVKFTQTRGGTELGFPWTAPRPISAGRTSTKAPVPCTSRAT